MDDLALLLSRLQFAFTISFHIIYPSFTIGLAAWLTILEALHLATRRPDRHHPNDTATALDGSCLPLLGHHPLLPEFHQLRFGPF
jgi:Cytochrome bd terminal oxidase subunit I